MKSIDVYKHKFPITNHMCLWRAICILLSTRCRYIYHIYSIKWHIGWSKWKSLLVKWIFGKWLILEIWNRCKTSVRGIRIQWPKINHSFLKNSKFSFWTIYYTQQKFEFWFRGNQNCQCSFLNIWSARIVSIYFWTIFYGQKWSKLDIISIAEEKNV